MRNSSRCKRWATAAATAIVLGTMACAEDDEGNEGGPPLPADSNASPSGDMGGAQDRTAAQPGDGPGDSSSQDVVTPAGDGVEPPDDAPSDGDDPSEATDPGSTQPTGDPSVWAQMGYDERNWYFNPHERTLSPENVGSLEHKWTFTTAGYPAGTPIVAEGKVFVMANGGTYAIELATGTEVWSDTGIRGTASVAYEDGFIYAHDERARLWKVSAQSGEVEWGPVTSDAQSGCDGTSSPILGGDLVIVGHSCGAREVGFGSAAGARGGVEAHRKSDGTKAWTHWTADPDETGAMVWSSVGIDVAAGIVYATTGNNYLAQGANSDAFHAMDLMSGDGLWKHQVRTGDVWSRPGVPDGPDSDFGANPIVTGDGTVAAGDKASAFWALDAETGSMLWGRENLTSDSDAAHGGILNNGAFDGTTFYATANDPSAGSATIFAMNAADGSDKFEPRTYQGGFAWGMPTLANGVLFVPVDDELHVLDAETGEQLNSFNVGGTIAAGGAAIADGHVVVGSGLTFIFDENVKNNNEVLCYGLP